MTRKLLVAAALLTSAMTRPAQAETTPIPYAADKAWKHPETGLTFPVEIAGFKRTKGFDFGETLSDVAFQYRAQDGTFVTLYYFRAGLPHVSIWADRVDMAMRQQSGFGTFDTKGRIWNVYTPTTGGKNSAIRYVYPLSGKAIKATGAAFQQRGSWLVVVRISSERLDAAELNKTLAGLMNALAYSPSGAAPDPAYAMRDCKDSLPRGGANQATSDGLTANDLPRLGIMLRAVNMADSKGTYCREPGSHSNASTVYRAGGSSIAYTIAYGDSGSVLRVVPWTLSSSPAGKQRMVGLFVTNDVILGFPSFDGLPSIEQAKKMLDGNASFGRMRLPGHDNKVELLN